VGELAARIWRQSGREGEPAVKTIGIRRGETMCEVLTAAGEEVGVEDLQGIAPIRGGPEPSAAEWLTERLNETPEPGEREAIWTQALDRADLLPGAARSDPPA
jgi:FlaA1/EpsC-like NDP-sugar epimerase